MKNLYRFFNFHLGGYARELYTFYKGGLTLSASETRKFVLFGRGRSGSTLLTQMLNSNPLVHCDKEIFNRPILFPRLFLHLRSKSTKAKVYGFKLLSYQLRDRIGQEAARDFLKYLHQEKGYSVVYMTRQNCVLQTLSKHYARFRGTWHQTSSTRDLPKMTVNIPQFMHDLHASLELDAFEAHCLENIPNFKVIYEKDLSRLEDQYRLMNELSRFLNIPYTKPELSLKKISSKKVSDYVENWDELKQTLADSKFSEFADFH